jgi:hypothetical protein
LREEHKPTVLENRVMSAVFGLKKDEVTRKWRKLHTEEFYDLYCSPDIIRVFTSRRMRWARHVAGMWDRTGTERVLMGET